MHKEQSRKPLDSGTLQPARNNEDLSQIALTEAHGDRAGGKTSTWEAQIRKQMPFPALLGKPIEKERPQVLDCMGSQETVGKVLR